MAVFDDGGGWGAIEREAWAEIACFVVYCGMMFEHAFWFSDFSKSSQNFVCKSKFKLGFYQLVVFWNNNWNLDPVQFFFWSIQI